MIDSKLLSIASTIIARMMEAISTTTALLASSAREGHETF